jgi:diguanylate cyclase (GGDEF)-like protein
MKIGDSRPLGGPVPAAARERGEMTSRPPSGAGRTIADAVSFMGIPEAELTPRVRDALMSLMGDVERLRREVEQIRKRLGDSEELADLDSLLPVLNRRAFVRELNRVVAYGRRYKESAGLVYFDIDNFKQVNDQRGHAAGDAALRHVAEIIVANIRESDVVGRLGGDEFGVILARTDEPSANAKAKALMLLMSMHPLLIDGEEIPLSISAGAIAFMGEEEPLEALARADKAMYRTKRGKA